MTELCKEIAQMGKGIGNENRYRILESIMDGPQTVGQIARLVNLSQPCVSQHLKILKSSDLVSDTRQGQEVLYAVNVSYMAALLKKLAINIKGKKKHD